MFDPKKYDTRMRDPEGKRKKPPVEERRRHLPREAELRERTEERFDEKRAEEPLPRAAKPGTKRSVSRTWWRVAIFGLLALIVWRFAAGAVGQGLLLVALGALAFFVAGMRRRGIKTDRAPTSATTYAPLPPRPGVPRPARRRRAAPKPTPRRSGTSSTSKPMSTWAIIGALSLVGTAVGGINKACKLDRDPRPSRAFEVPELPPARPGRSAVDRWQTHLPSEAPDRISGAVLFGGRQAVPHVRLLLVPAHGPTLRGETDEHGIFVFDRVQAPTATLEVRGDVHLGASGRNTLSLPAGTRGGVITLHPQHTILLQRGEGHRAQAGTEAAIQVAETNGPLSGHGTWELSREVALVTGLAPTAYYDVLVQSPGRRRAGLVERVAAGQQVVVTLQRSTTVHGRILLPLGAAPSYVEVVLTHGRLVVPARVSGFGWQADHLPRGSWWDVTARRKGHAGAREATQTGVHAGTEGPIVLDLR